MRKPVVFAALLVALATAAGGVALAFAAGDRPASVASSTVGGEVAAAPVRATDYCFVEAMIYYRVEESELAGVLLEEDSAATPLRDLAADLVAEGAAELEELREWYLSWADARPLQPPADGPCAGHGSDHAQMPGMPSWSQRVALADAEGTVAEAAFADIALAQNAGVIALAEQILAGDPHPRVLAAAEDTLARARSDVAALEELRAALP